MTTDKPKWWLSWVIYGLVGLLLSVGPYVGGYFLFGKRVDYPHLTERHFGFKYAQGLYSPLGRAEALVCDKDVTIYGTNGYVSWGTD
ncbi:hypothetical protein Pan258_44320 [Symmachiella dynata]|uniref:hypothetical protein n=1 Tax=Symmachiella dynata TaxID=2527995 RepID=UPI00118CD3B0|nr:hypothetical protein [Symmachiella dynata]QDT50375.1 hypothetical protein Pan258_44320 [Symmachiella dynata]